MVPKRNANKISVDPHGSLLRYCISQSKCAKYIAIQSWGYRIACCSADLCNKDYDTGEVVRMNVV